MSAFEFGNYPHSTSRHSSHNEHDNHHEHEQHHMPVIQEPILTMKIYDSCRSKECLSAPELGPARSYDGRPIVAPHGAQSVAMDDLRIERIVVLKKEPSPFRKGYWNLELQYVFSYKLQFFGAEGIELEETCATNTFTRRISLFGSEAKDVSLFTDLLGNGETLNGSGAPSLLVEAKAIALTVDLNKKCDSHNDNPFEPHEEAHHHHHKHVFATIGLFSITKLYRLVSLMVESRGFVIPPTCENIMPPNPCDFFETLHFPMDSFAPPQKKEFKAGISLNIAPEKHCTKACGNACKCR